MDSKFKIQQSVLIDCFVSTTDLIIPDIVTTIGIGLFSTSHIFERFIQSVLSAENNNFSKDKLQSMLCKEFNNHLPLRFGFQKASLQQLKSKFHIQEQDCYGVLSELSRVTTVYLPLNLKKIETCAFIDLINLNTICYEGSKEDWQKVDISDNNLSNLHIRFSQKPPYSKTSNISDEIYGNTLYIRGSNYSIEKQAYFAYNRTTEAVILPTVTSIKERAFLSSHFVNIEMADTVTQISEYAFSHSDLESITLSKNLINIASNTFSDCIRLSKIDLSCAVEIIGDYAFSNCNNLNTVYFSKKLKRIGNNTFQNCHNIEYFILLDNLTSIGKSAFKNCYGLKSLVIFSDISTVPVSMCEDCKNLEILILPSSLRVVESRAFLNCPKTCKVLFQGTKEQWKKIRIGVNNDILLEGVEFS